ncbi:MAG: hypothetical protein ACYCUI_15640 [Vulcanimicrobiaceae bacterium]
MIVYPVVGGWQAQDQEQKIACFGESEEEAKGALAAAQERAAALLNDSYQREREKPRSSS